MAPLLLTVSTKASSYKNAGMMCDTCLEVSEQRHEEPGVICLSEDLQSFHWLQSVW